MTEATGRGSLLILFPGLWEPHSPPVKLYNAPHPELGGPDSLKLQPPASTGLRWQCRRPPLLLGVRKSFYPLQQLYLDTWSLKLERAVGRTPRGPHRCLETLGCSPPPPPQCHYSHSQELLNLSNGSFSLPGGLILAWGQGGQ